MQCDDISAIKQHAWDELLITADKASISSTWSSLMDRHNRTRLLATSLLHSVEWLHVLSVATCGKRLDNHDNKAIFVAVGLSLGISLCKVHIRPCGTLMDAKGTQTFL